MSKAKDLKRVAIDGIKQDIQSAQSIIVVDYKGITVEQDTDLRNKFREAGVKYRVLKNRLVKIAFNELGITEFDNYLNDTNAFAFGIKDPISPAKVAEAAQSEKRLKLKCGRMGDMFLDEAGVNALAKIPPKEQLVAMFLGLLKEPVARFARVLSAVAEKKA